MMLGWEAAQPGRAKKALVRCGAKKTGLRQKLQLFFLFAVTRHDGE